MKVPTSPSFPQFGRSELVLSLKIATILIASLAIFYQDLNIIFTDALQSESTSHILVIPILLVYLIYRKRKMLRATMPLENQNQPETMRHLPTIAGMLLSTTAILLYWLGSYTFLPLEYHIIALPIFVAGLCLILFNYRTLRQLAFPIAFLIFLMPPPSEILYGFGATLSIVSSEASSAIVNALGISSTISYEIGNPTVIITRPDSTTMGFTVDIACSGIYSLIGFVIFAAFVAYIIRDKTWKKILIFLLGLPLIYLLNIVRVTTILLIGYQFGEQLALQLFHLLGGWILIFIGTLILLAVTEKAFKTQIFTRKQQNSCQRCNPSTPNPLENFCSNCGRLLKYPHVSLRKADIAKIATVAFAIIILVSIQAPVFALTKGPAPIMIQTPEGEEGNTGILPQIRGYTLNFSYRDTYFEEKAGQDFSLIYTYTPMDKAKEPVWVGVEIASTRSSLHRWETCLYNYPIKQGRQPRVTQLDLRDTQILQNPPIIARYFAFQYKEGNQTQVVLYWYETTTFTVDNATKQEHVELSVVMYPDSPENVAETENQLLPFAISVVNYWQPIKTWNQISLIISKNGISLIIFPLAILTLTLGTYIIENHREKRRNTNAYKKLAREEQKTVEALKSLEPGITAKLYNIALAIHLLDPTTHKTIPTETIPTINNIASAYQKTNKETIDPETLLHKLEKTEEISLTQEKIANVQDEPTLTWKTQISPPKKQKPTLHIL